MPANTAVNRLRGVSARRSSEGVMMQLYPHRHATDGFFALAVERTGS